MCKKYTCCIRFSVKCKRDLFLHEEILDYFIISCKIIFYNNIKVFKVQIGYKIQQVCTSYPCILFFQNTFIKKKCHKCRNNIYIIDNQ